MSKTKLITAAVIAGSCVLASQAAMAYSAGDFFVRGGVAKSDTRSDSRDFDDVSNERGFTYGVGYLFADNVGVELSGSEKIEHDFTLGDETAAIDRMPVNLMVNYYPLGGFDSKVQPYVGAGLNYTRFSGEPEGTSVRRSYGAVGQVGLDLAITDNVMLNGFANYADVDARVSGDDGFNGNARLDPVSIGGGVTLRF